MASELLRERRERVFLVLAAVFLGAMTLLNVVGITRFIQLGPLALAVGVLPYPLTPKSISVLLDVDCSTNRAHAT